MSCFGMLKFWEVSVSCVITIEAKLLGKKKKGHDKYFFAMFYEVDSQFFEIFFGSLANAGLWKLVRCFLFF